MSAAAGGVSVGSESGISGTPRPGTDVSGLATPPDIGEAADNLRAEVATARILVQQIKQQQQQKRS